MTKETEMPVKAYVFLDAKEGTAMTDTAKKLEKIEYVTDVKPVYGVHDGIASVEAPDMDKLREAVTWGLRRDDGVNSTLTLIVVTDKDRKPIGFKKGQEKGKFEYIHPSLLDKPEDEDLLL